MVTWSDHKESWILDRENLGMGRFVLPPLLKKVHVKLLIKPYFPPSFCRNVNFPRDSRWKHGLDKQHKACSVLYWTTVQAQNAVVLPGHVHIWWTRSECICVTIAAAQRSAVKSIHTTEISILFCEKSVAEHFNSGLKKPHTEISDKKQIWIQINGYFHLLIKFKTV